MVMSLRPLIGPGHLFPVLIDFCLFRFEFFPPTAFFVMFLIFRFSYTYTTEVFFSAVDLRSRIRR